MKICIVYYSVMDPAYLRRQGKGCLLLMLHAHLPFIRYPEHENFLEENWFYEALTETYIPLIELFENLLNDNVDFRVALSLSPPLVEMLRDKLLMSRYTQHLYRLIDLSEKEIFRNRKNIRLRDLGKMYLGRFLKTLNLLESVYGRDLISAFRGFAGSGKIEIITSASTHGYLPALMAEPAAVQVQIHLAVEHYRSIFGKNPPGIWLPECGFKPEMETIIKAAGIGYFFLEQPAAKRAHENRKEISCSFKTPLGLTVFGRDTDSSRQVWSAQEGYPGDADYREFYRDIGHDLDFDYISPFLPGSVRTFTGIKYFRITDSGSDKKKPYNRIKALRKARIHARDFLKAREKQIASMNREKNVNPVITAAFDAELFGHWWFEGPEWLNQLFRIAPAEAKTLRFVTPSEYMAESPATEIIEPGLSSWGAQGYSTTWIHPSNSWMYRHLHRAARCMKEISIEKSGAKGLARRALNQAARELLLAQASDWAFMIQKEKASEFATRKFTEHINNFSALYDGITSGQINREALRIAEEKNNIFADIDFRIYAREN